MESNRPRAGYPVRGKTVTLLAWRLVLRSGLPAPMHLPSVILTAAPAFRSPDMPEEVAMLLPVCSGPRDLIDEVEGAPSRCPDAMIGLFMASPFLNVGVEGARLAEIGVHWITNMPSVEQQDEEFSRLLVDVELDGRRELACLGGFAAQGFNIIAVVADGAGAAAAASIAPRAILVLPRVGDFAAGFPSLHQRDTAAQSVAKAARETGWSGPVLGLGEAREAESEELWPRHVDGIVCRPALFSSATA